MNSGPDPETIRGQSVALCEELDRRVAEFANDELPFDEMKRLHDEVYRPRARQLAKAILPYAAERVMMDSPGMVRSSDVHAIERPLYEKQQALILLRGVLRILRSLVEYLPAEANL
jgi:hypothetical protein